VYVLRWWDGGPVAAAAAVVASPIAGEPFVLSAIERVAGEFAGPDRVGAADYAALAAAGRTEAEAARARNEAVLVVRQFAEALGPPNAEGA